MLGRRGGGSSFVACLGHVTVDHASISRRSTVATPNIDTSNVCVLSKFIPYVASKLVAHLISFLFGRLWPPSFP